MTDIMILTPRDFSLRAQETVRVFVEGDYLLLRVTVVGPYFPHRDSAPFVRIVTGHRRSESLMADITSDQTELRGYFPTDTAVAGFVEFGYASQVIGRIAIKRLKPARLDPRRLQRSVRRVTRRSLGPFRRQSAIAGRARPHANR